MNKFLIIICLFTLGAVQVHAQKTTVSRKKGAIYVTNLGSSIPFTHSVSFSNEEEDIYITSYKIFIDNQHKFDVIAKHIKKERSVVVEVAVAGGGLLAMFSKQETDYDAPSKEVFGFGGVGRVLEGNRIPAQLAVKFLSDDYTYVEVVDVLGYHGNDGAEYYSFY